MTSCDRHNAHWTGHRTEHCCSCGNTFTGTTAGDKHRVGDHAVFVGPSRRRCLTADEMLAKGMDYTVNAFGTMIWGTGQAHRSQFWALQDDPGLRTGQPEGNHPQSAPATLSEMGVG